MRRRSTNRWLACLLAPLLLIANVVPLSTVSCKASATASGKKCCGRCQASVAPAHSCCKPQPACCAKLAAAVQPKCCCKKGSSTPVAPAPVPEEGQKLKQILLAGLGQSGLVVLAPAPEPAKPSSSPVDIRQPPVRVLFCIWLT